MVSALNWNVFMEEMGRSKKTHMHTLKKGTMQVKTIDCNHIKLINGRKEKTQ